MVSCGESNLYFKSVTYRVKNNLTKIIQFKHMKKELQEENWW